MVIGQNRVEGFSGSKRMRAVPSVPLRVAALCLAFASLSLSVQAATIRGFVFRDVNGNGLRDANQLDTGQDGIEAGIAGVSVAAIDAAGTSVTGTFSTCSGRDAPIAGCVNSIDRFYSITVPDNASYRLEIFGLSSVANGVLSAGVQSDGTIPAGQAGSASAVQFVSVTTGNSDNNNFSLQYADQFCAANPDIAAPKYLFRGTDGTANATSQGFISFGYQSGTTLQNDGNAAGPRATNTSTSPIDVQAQNIGATWGVARDRRFNTLFTAAFTRRHVPFRDQAGDISNGIGHIYRMGTAGGATVPTVYVDFESASFRTNFPDAVTTDFGSGDRDPHNDTTPNYEDDLTAWDNVGKSGFGDIDVGPDGNLYVTALRDRRLYRIPVLASGTPTAAQVTAFTIPDPSGTCANGVARPFALGFHDGRGYVGVTCTGETAGGSPANLRAVVFEFNPALAIPTFTQVFDFPLNYGRGCASQNSGGQAACTTSPSEWRAWTTDFTCGQASPPFTAQQICPQPMVSDLVFDEFGYVTVMIADRLGWQAGNSSAGTRVGTTEGVSAGEILRVERNASGTWIVESQGQVAGMTRDAGNDLTTQLNPGGIGAGTLPAGLEWYWHDDYNNVDDGIHSDTMIGGAVVVPGNGEVVSGAFDPVSGGPFRSGGFAWFSNWRVDDVYNYGERTRSFLQFGQDELGTFGKAAGLGDLEAVCGQAPLQIGNRVWSDLNANGVQDAGEPGFAGVPITLVNAAGTTIGQTTTESNGNWYFRFETLYSGSDVTLTDATVRLTEANLYGQTVSVMVGNTSATGVGTAGSINASRLTTSTANSGVTGVGSVERDSNGVLLDPPGTISTSVGTSVTLPASVGQSVHSIDFGFVPSDFGDLPDGSGGVGAGNYQTLLSDNGPHNQLIVGLRLGVSAGTLSPGYDFETDAVPSATAVGDDSATVDDENGATFPSVRIGVNTVVALDVLNDTGAPQNLCGYIDFNNNGSFLDAGESATASVSDPGAPAQQSVNLTFTGTLGAGAYANNRLYSRFRIQTAACSPTGFGGSGEVEDYAIPVTNVAIASSAGGTYCPGQGVTYAITITNPAAAETATAFPFTADLVGSDEGNLQGTPLFAVANWALTSATGGATIANNTPAGNIGSGDINTTVNLPAGSSLTITVQGNFTNATTGAQAASANVLPVAGFADRNASDVASGSFTPTTACQTVGLGALCPNLAASGPGALNPQPLPACTGATVVNTYYPSAATISSGANCIQVGAVRAGGGPAIARGDLLLVVQMQGATISSGNNALYGDGLPLPNGASPGGATSATAGRFEYVIAQSAVGAGACPGANDVEISGGGPVGSAFRNGTINGYTHNPADAQRSTYQVVRVPVYTTVNTASSGCSINALAWNGSTGGIVSFDATQTVNLGSTAATRINAAGLGFRGGVCSADMSTDSASDLFAATSDASSAGKGEGYAGTPVAVQVGAGGYTGGDFGRGAPGNAGGGGQRCDAEMVTGGGGGGGRVSGGAGAQDTRTGPAATCTFTAHGGGSAIVPDDATRLLLGGGGGCGAKASGGTRVPGVGGGAILIRAQALTGTGTLTVNGAAALTPDADNNSAGSGGGGGGTMIVLTNIAASANNYANIQFSANGGNGTPTNGTADSSGGGGGGAGNLYRSSLPFNVSGGTANTLGGTSTNGSAGANASPVTNLDPTASSPGVKPAYICAQNSTVPVTLSHVSTRLEGSELIVDFSVASEAGTLGYRVLADIDDKLRVEMGSVASSKIDTLQETNYSVRGRSIGATQIWIEEQSILGKAELYGPFPIGKAVGERGLATNLNWAAVQTEQARFRSAQRTALRGPAGAGTGVGEITVSESRWVELSAAELRAAGIVGSANSGADKLSDVLVSAGSRKVPTRITRDATGQVQSLGFFARAVSDSLYTKTATYRISNGVGEALAIDSPVTSGNNSALSEVKFSDDKLYTFAAPFDPWFTTRATRSTPGTVNFTLSDYQAGSSDFVKLEFFGGLDYAGDQPDHHVQFAINGTVIGEDTFDGLAARNLRFNVPAGALRTGSNSLTVTTIADTGFAADIVNVEAITVGYTRQLAVQNNRLDYRVTGFTANMDGFANGFEDATSGTNTQSQTLAIRGITTPVIVVRERDGVTSLAAELSGDGSIIAAIGDRIFVSPKQSAAIHPAASDADPITGTSYLIISHPSFADQLESFVTAKRAMGFTVQVVDVEAIYRHYNAGIVDPNAISAAIRRAAGKGTTHVLLVGGDSYDYFNILGINSVSFIPTHYRRTDSLISFAPADSVFADTNNDQRPDISLGRWPVRTQAELQNIVSKTLAYQNTNKALLLNDRTLNGQSYSQVAAPLASMLNANFSSSVLDLDQFPVGQTAAARAELVSRMNQGVSLLSYFGHSAPAAWSREGLVTANQVYGGLFSSVQAPFTTVQYGCWATYFVEPSASTVAHGMLLQAQGAAAVIGATALTQTHADVDFAAQLMPRFGKESLGEALKASVQVLQQNNVTPDVVIGATLLGDPSLR